MTEMNQSGPGQGPLSGLRICDMTTVIMGPYATQILADYGAEVVKVEAPTGDTTRQIPPMRNPGMGCIFLHLNRNKKSVALDLKDPDAVTALFEVVAECDVLIANVRPAGLARLGITYDALRERNPDLIWISLVGFGSGGRYGGRPAYDDLIQGLTAVPSMLVAAGSEVPHYVPVSFNDRAVGLHAAIALLAAVRHRDVTGEGQFIEVPMYETMVQFTLGDHLGGETFEPANGPMGYRRTLTRERRPYATKDGFLCLLVYTDAHWRSFLKIVGRSDLMESDPRFASLLSRTEYADDLYKVLREELLKRTTAEWLAAFAESDVPAVPLHTIESALDDEHLADVGFFQTVDHPTEGRMRSMGVPTRWSGFDPPEPSPAPALGEHTREVLSATSLKPEMIDRLAPGADCRKVAR
jgi:crotonobetainyl-CoA:carnitine CoA-transferase CaiB-like acyl-CoA transferase